MADEFDWDFDDPETKYEQQMISYNKPITEHTCDDACNKKIIQNYHEVEEVFDAFELSQRQREKMRMEVVQARGKDNKEMTLIRMFARSLPDEGETGDYILRLQTVTQLTAEHMGDILFDTRAEVEAYYNYAVETFGFSKTLQITHDDLFDFTPALDGLFDGLNDDEDFDELFEGLDDEADDEPEGLWD